MDAVLIIGAGASGLMAGYLLGKAGYPVTILESRDRVGGRIHTHHKGAFSKPAELGAEFVHGNLSTTLDLLQEAGISYHTLEGEMWHYSDGRFHQNEEQTPHWPLLLEKLSSLKEDCSILEFLDKAFPEDKYAEMRTAVIRFVQGYDAADAGEISSFSLREEWTAEEEDQYRIEGGYGRLTGYLYEQCKKQNARFHLSEEVVEVTWQQGRAVARTKSGMRYEADKLVCAVPVALLQQEMIRFVPAIPAYIKAAQDIGSGHVIKFILQFKEDFWKETNIARLDKLHMLLSDQEIPTWWTQYPEGSALLTGWIGGPPAEAMKHLTKEALLNKALDTLSRIFSMPAAALSARLDDWEIANWSVQPFSGMAYSYEKPAAEQSKILLNTPVADTLYFTGEALYKGRATGTVEAALNSGKITAGKITDDTITQE